MYNLYYVINTVFHGYRSYVKVTTEAEIAWVINLHNSSTGTEGEVGSAGEVGPEGEDGPDGDTGSAKEI